MEFCLQNIFKTKLFHYYPNKKTVGQVQFIDGITEQYNMNNVSKKNNIVYCVFSFVSKSEISGEQFIAKIPTDYKPSYGSGFFTNLRDTYGRDLGQAWISVSGDIFYYNGNTSLPIGTVVYANCCYMV